MFSFLRRHQPPNFGYSDLKVDMHSHILPGIDDGAVDLSTALNLVRGLTELGYEKLIATPHVMGGLYHNNYNTITSALDTLKSSVHSNGIQVELSAAAEYMLDENFTLMVNNGEQLLTLDGKQVLIELPQAGAPRNWQQVFFQLQTQGYEIVLAHPERYRFWNGNLDVFKEMCDKNVLLQLNLLSLSGYYGDSVSRWARHLLRKNMVSYLGTDLHHERHLKALENFPFKKIWTKDISRDWNNPKLLMCKN